ncbi:MAG: T9SS type A sorting domain-containing protein [Candidatus Edwardsbacteria bacterium]|nr:T9SS type A sorting domain-containing protein [Candidatus Edwardsbacteria bacterium]MBU1576596.1 T9SS type A sorting domain-containing protein [Candidatus Edwardsbacteria bacterium]MBU2464397.1 T9SS type A sorting domain-containing protein [Candidatus Edwardsbacteria bacterium]MBU2594939.1 T9SS type A sorting domain-containing protein [Candidatus Edwardsbacteria bacterium]
MKKLWLMVLLTAAFACVAQAAQDTCKIFLWDNDAGEATQRAPAAVMDENYGSRYVWADSRDGNFNIYGRIWERKPAAATGSFLVNRIRVDEHTQEQPDVAGTVGDFFFVVWQDSVMKPGELWQLYGRKLDKNGKPMTDEIRVTEKIVNNAKFPKVAVNKRTQDFVIVWQEDRDGQIDIWARLFNYKFEPQSPDIKLNEDGLKVAHILPVVSFSDKGIAVAWQDNRDGLARADIYFRYFKPDLSPLTASKQVNSDVERWHFTPAIAVSDTGYFTIVWLSFQSNAYGDIGAQRFDPDAKPINLNIKVNLTVAPVACRIPSVTMGIDNVSFWTSWADSQNTSLMYQIRARYFDKAGRFNAAVKTVNQNPWYGQRAPAVCRFGELFSVAWLDSSRVNGRGDIFGQYYMLNVNKDDTLDAVGVNYNISNDKAAGRTIWYHPKKNYDNPSTPGWNEDPIAEPDSIYIPLDSAYVLAFKERNIPNQLFVQITNTEVLEYMWRDKQKLNSSAAYDLCLLDLGYAEDGSTAGVIQEEQQDSLEAFATDSLSCLIVAGNDFGEMYNATTLFSYFGSKYIGPGNSSETGNIQKISGLPGTFTEGMNFDYPFQQGPDNSVDIIGPLAAGSQLVMESDGPGKITYGRATTYGSYYKGEKASTHKNVYLTFSIGSLSNGIHPSTASELTRRILAYQGFNVEPEPIVDLVDSVYTGTIEGTVELSWTAVSDDDATEKATKYWLKYSKYNSAVSDLGKISSEIDFIDTGSTYYQTWTPANAGVLEKKTVYGFAPGDTLIFALKAGDESSPIRWGTLGNEPRIVASGDTVTPHTIRLGYITFGAVNDFCKSERIGTRIGAVGLRDTLFTTWDASNLYLGYGRNDWRTAGDLLFYFDTRTGGADSTFKYNGTGSAGFDINFRPDFCLIFENADSISLKKWNGSAWVDSVPIATYLASNRPYLDSINKFTYAEMRVPFSYLKYTVGNVFKFLAVSQYETSDNPWNAFPTTNSITTKGAKVPAKYGSYYQFNSLASGVSPRVVATPLAVELSMFAAAYEQGSVNLAWRSGLEEDHDLWLVERSSDDGRNYARLVELPGSGSGSDYSYQDNSALLGQAYLYRLGAQDNMEFVEWYGPVLVNTPVAADIYSYSLKAMPNPFNNNCQIRYSTNRQERMALKVYDICGHLVKTIFDDVKQPGSYAANWTGTDDNGRNLANGVYFYRLTSGQGCLTQKITLLR